MLISNSLLYLPHCLRLTDASCQSREAEGSPRESNGELRGSRMRMQFIIWDHLLARPADQGSEMRPLSLIRGARPRSRFSLSASALSSSNLRTCKSAIPCTQLSTYTDTFATRLPPPTNRLQLSRGGKEDPARRGRRRSLGPMGGYWQGAGWGGGICWRLCFSRGKCCSSTAVGRAARDGDGRETPPTPASPAAPAPRSKGPGR